MDTVNVFIAYMLPEDKRKDLDQIAAGVREIFHPEGKDESFYHSTLLFIGRVDVSELPSIREKMADLARRQTSIEMDLNRIGYFYDKRKQCIKVLYAVPDRIPQALDGLCRRLYQTIGQPLIGKTTPPIRPARIHFTITKRLKHRLSEDEFQTLTPSLKSFRIPVTINSFGLYHCKDPEHRYYREICDDPFQGQEDSCMNP